MLKMCVVLFIVSFSLYLTAGCYPIEINKIKDADYENLKIVLIMLERLDELFSHLSRPRYGRSAISPSAENALDEQLIPCSNQYVKTCRLTLNDKWICYKHPSCDEKMGEKGAVNSSPSVQGSHSEPGPIKGPKNKPQEEFAN
ncbi:uncharacterized protein TNCV_946321 [Trichonephila clavipes]|nr:uncharacterized protein TNCV_946321 [Trichonephila clavipes]